MRKRVFEKILSNHPDIKSPAALVLLRRKLLLRDPAKRYDECRTFRIKYHFTFLQRVEQRYHRLNCFYCGKRLKLEEATVDHFVPKSLGGAKMDYHNYRVCCLECNHEKAAIHPDSEEFDLFIKKIQHRVS
jgi:5-methylcytosine-specific restriction endonuclease McrA